MYFDHNSMIAPRATFLELRHFSIYWSTILIAIGILVALSVSTREGAKKGLPREIFDSLLFYGFPLCILGARFYFVLFNLRFFIQNPAEILAIHDGGLAIYGVIIVAGLFSWRYLKKKKMPILPVLDVVAIGFFVAQIIIRVGDFLNQQAYGVIVSGETLDAQRAFLSSLFIPRFIINGMFINGNYHHPVFLYDMLWNVVGLLIVFFILRKRPKTFVGEIAAFYAVWYSFGNFFVESLRADRLMIGPIPMTQVISLVVIIGVTNLVIYRLKNDKEPAPYATFTWHEMERTIEEENTTNHHNKNKPNAKKNIEFAKDNKGTKNSDGGKQSKTPPDQNVVKKKKKQQLQTKTTPHKKHNHTNKRKKKGKKRRK